MPTRFGIQHAHCLTSGTSKVNFSAQPGYRAESWSVRGHPSSSFARSTHRPSPSWKFRNDCLTSWSSCVVTRRYTPPACCNLRKAFLSIWHAFINHVLPKLYQYSIVTNIKDSYRVLYVKTLRCISTWRFSFLNNASQREITLSTRTALVESATVKLLS